MALEIKNLQGEVIHIHDGDMLTDADLFGANLCGANLFDADLRDANLYGANLRGIKVNDKTTF